jgi:amidophosphoribosyltransferase
MCGIFGIFLFNENENAYQYILKGVTLLQHRGQDAAGISTCKNATVFTHKNIGKVDEVFKHDKSGHLLGNYGIGHVRYSTTGNLSYEQSQPLYTNFPHGISIVHNGNLTNTEKLLAILKMNNIHINFGSDSEILLNYFALLFKKNVEDGLEFNSSIFKTVEEIMENCRGSYSVILMINGYGLVAFRDSYGIRPLCLGQNENIGYAFSSESVSLDCIDFKLTKDINAGECCIITKSGINSKIVKTKKLMPCLFEYIYFARPETIMDGILVYQARKNMGETLANKIIKEHPDILNEIDVVMPVPDSGRISALRVSYIINKPYCEGLIKNNYIGRTFIMSTQNERKHSIKMKLNTINQEFKDKTILLIDDSIVRGNTSIQLIKRVKNTGVKKIIFASIAPPIIYPNLYGISIPTSEELIAYNKTTAEICEKLGADYLIYNNLNDIINTCKALNPDIFSFEKSCFDGSYL